jgi:Bifunctional DNA primase/polymerase, N-terminal/HNH endonuclease
MADLEKALEIAKKVPVFPCKQVTKQPLTENSFKNASQDADVIVGWWSKHPDALIGVPAVAVDHIIAIASGGDAFPPLDRLMSLCASCHNRKTRVVEQLGEELTMKGCDVDGMPLDPGHPWYCGVKQKRSS